MPDVPATAVVARRETPKDQYLALESLIRQKEDAIVATLAPTISRDRFISVSLQAISRSPKLLECSPASILRSLRDAAELGLEPSGLMGQAYLVPYYNKYTRRLDAQLIPGYRGLIDLARRSGELVNIEAHVVRARDEFDYHRDEHGTHYVHHPYINRGGDVDTDTGEVLDRGPYIGAFCAARLRGSDGSTVLQFEFMDTTEIESNRSRSKAADDGPWKTDWAEMAKKTVARRILKYLPVALTSPVNRALEMEDVAEGTAEPRSAVVTVHPATGTTPAIPASLDAPDGRSDDDDVAPTPDADEPPANSAPDPVNADEPAPDSAPEPDPFCRAPDPFGEDYCTLVPGHVGNHAHDNSKWPARKAARG